MEKREETCKYFIQHMLSKKIIRYASHQARCRKVHLTLYTKDNCQLCITARDVLNRVMKECSYERISLEVVDIMKPENSDSFERYCYDVPVLHIRKPSMQKPIKFMHNFDHEKLLKELQT